MERMSDNLIKLTEENLRSKIASESITYAIDYSRYKRAEYINSIQHLNNVELKKASNGEEVTLYTYDELEDFSEILKRAELIAKFLKSQTFDK